MKARAKLVVALAASGLTLAAAHAQRGSLIQQAPPRSLRAKNPFQGSERAAKAGAKLYGRGAHLAMGAELKVQERLLR